MSITFSGLASGLDSASMIDQLVAAEKAPATRLQSKVSDLQSQSSIVNNIAGKLRTLGEQARGLDLASEIRSVKVDRSDTTHVGVAVSSAATVSNHTLRVDTTARGQVVTSRVFASDTAGVLGAGSVTMKTGTGTPVTVSWDATDSLSTIAQRINDAGGPASASVVNDGTGYRLVATSRDTGTAAAPIFTDAGDGLGWSNPANVTLGARDASFTLDGIPMTRGKNVVDDALPGVTFTLTAAHAATEPDTLITVSSDPDALRTKVKGVVDAFNSVATALNGQLRYNGTKMGTDTLFGDSTLRQLQGALGTIATDLHGSGSLAAVGVKLDTSGLLSIDQSAFDDALAKDPSAVEHLFVDGGLASVLGNLSDQYTKAGDGILSTKTASLGTQVTSYQKDITRIEDAATSLGDRLRVQFTKLEQAISDMQSQSARLKQILG